MKNQNLTCIILIGTVITCTPNSVTIGTSKEGGSIYRATIPLGEYVQAGDRIYLEGTIGVSGLIKGSVVKVLSRGAA